MSSEPDFDNEESELILRQPSEIQDAEPSFQLFPQPGGTSLQGFTFPPLYKRDKFDKVHVWVILFDGVRIVARWAEQEKFRQGVYQENTKDVTLNQTGRNMYEQALLHMQRTWKDKQMKTGYVTEFSDSSILTLNPMLATEWNEKKIKRWPVYVQPKLDGIRCLANYISNQARPEDSIEYLSRTNKPFHHMNHIRIALVPLFEIMKCVLRSPDILNSNLFALYPGLKNKLKSNSIIFRFDGEFYSFDAFNKISSITSQKSHPHPDEAKIKYHIFDIPMSIDLTCDERYYLLRIAFTIYFQKYPAETSPLRLVDTYSAMTNEEIHYANQIFSSWGYEGVIIRKVEGEIVRGTVLEESIRDTSYYLTKRGQNLLKFKSRHDDEGVIIGASEGTGNQKGLIIWIVQLKNGKQLTLQPREEFEVRRKQLQEWIATGGKAFLGRKYRYLYQEISPDGIPRFAVGDGFVDDR